MAHSRGDGGSWGRNSRYFHDSRSWKSDGAKELAERDVPPPTLRRSWLQSYSSQKETRPEDQDERPMIPNTPVWFRTNASSRISHRGGPGQSISKKYEDLTQNVSSNNWHEDHDPNLSNGQRVDGPPRVAPTKSSPTKYSRKVRAGPSKVIFSPKRRRGDNVHKSSVGQSGATSTFRSRSYRPFDLSINEDASGPQSSSRRADRPKNKQTKSPKLSLPNVTLNRYAPNLSQSEQRHTSEPMGASFAQGDQPLTPDSMSFSSPDIDARSITEEAISSPKLIHHHASGSFLAALSSTSQPDSLVEQAEQLTALVSDPIPGLDPGNGRDNSRQVFDEARRLPVKRHLSPLLHPNQKKPRLFKPDNHEWTNPLEANSPAVHGALEGSAASHILAEPAPASPQIKLESSPTPLLDPIDVDAPSLSLYEELGLPGRTSGSHRVVRPVFKRSDPRGKERWAEQICDEIRWVRGRGEGARPLVIGNIFWRSDGVCFDWKVSDEEFRQRSSNLLSGASNGPVNDNMDQGNVLSGDRHRLSSVQHSDIPSSGHTEEPPDSARNASVLASLGSVKEEVDDDISISLLAPRTNASADKQSSAGGIATNKTPLSPKSLVGGLSPQTLSNIAICFLDRFTRCFDYPAARSRLVDAYSSHAIMSLQFNDLPTVGTCPRFGRPERQTHLIMDFASRDHGRNLLSASEKSKSSRKFHGSDKLAIGPEAILDRLSSFDDLSHSSSAVPSQQYQFDIVPLPGLDSLMLKYRGALYTRTTSGDSNEGSLSLRFDRTFILQPNRQDAQSWIDWPWIISNDQLTLFHRPGVICQCPY